MTFLKYYISIHAPRVGGDFPRPRRTVGWWYFNPRPPCGGRPDHRQPGGHRRHISIHAPRVGGDLSYRGPRMAWIQISIHAPRVGGDASSGCSYWAELFQSTPPVWGATAWCPLMEANKKFQSTPPVWGATGSASKYNQIVQISIHAPRVGGDIINGCHPVRRNISIHAPRVGGDR